MERAGTHGYAAAGMAALAMFAAACGGDSNDTSSTAVEAAAATTAADTAADATSAAESATDATTAADTATTATTEAETAASGEKYEIYLSNNYLGNDWRQQMERTAKAAASIEPLGSRVNLTIENTDNDPTKQIQSLNNIILKKPDAILIDASSPDALNPTIARACAQDITVISFDQTVTAECAWKVHTDFSISGAVGAKWLAETLGGKGDIIMDRGLAGVPVSLDIVKAFEGVLKDYPDIKVVGTYESQYALAPEEQGAAALVASHPKIDGVLSQSYGTGVQNALKKAGRKPIPMYSQAYNGSFVMCATLEGIECAITSNPATLGAEAMKVAVDVLDGKTVEKEVVLPSPAFSTNDVTVEGTTFEQIAVDKNAFPDLPPGATIPFSPTWTEITPEQAQGT